MKKAGMTLAMILGIAWGAKEANAITLEQADNIHFDVAGQYFNTPVAPNFLVYPDPVAHMQYDSLMTIYINNNGNTVSVTPKYSVQGGVQAVFNLPTTYKAHDNENIATPEQQAAMAAQGIDYLAITNIEDWTEDQYRDALIEFYGNNYVADLDPFIVGIPKLEDVINSFGPNPTKGNMMLYFKDEGKYNVDIYDLAGKKVGSDIFEGRTGMLELGKYANGTYILGIRKEDDNQVNLKVVKN